MGARVLIDARAAIRPETGGVERWAKELCARLPEISPDTYSVAAPHGALAHRLGHAWEQAVLPVRTVRGAYDALLCPANLAPVLGSRNIVILHDAAPLRFPSDYSRAYVAWQRALLPRLAKSSLRIITPSGFSRDELVALCGADPNRITVVEPGVPDGFNPGADFELSHRQLGLSRPYVLTVASRVARKNIGALDQAAVALAREGIDLVAVGGSRPQLRSDTDRACVRDLGVVADDVLPGLYAGARAFVLPSIYEGYGLPVIEAMASGTPVVCSSRSALPEAAGGAALLVDPSDRDGIAKAVIDASCDLRVGEELIAKGLKRASQLSWQSTAEEVDRVCVSAAAGS